MSTGESSTVAKAIQVLQELAASTNGVAVSDLADRIGTQRASLYRILKSLESAWLIRRDEHKMYHLGSGLVRLAAAAAQPFEEVARPALQELANLTDCSAMLLLRAGDDIVTTICATPHAGGMYITTQPGHVHPSGRVASRVAIEAGRPALPDDPDDVRMARKVGYAVSGGADEGVRLGIAAPVRLDALSEEGCILLVTLSAIDVEGVSGRLKETAKELGRMLSHD